MGDEETVSISTDSDLHPGEAAAAMVPPDGATEPTPGNAKPVYMIKIFEVGGGGYPRFESDFHWGLKKDAVAALQAMKDWSERHTTLKVEGRLFCDTQIQIAGVNWERLQNTHEVEASQSAS